jgi:dsDNA-binding SOS-regulon protein
LAHYNKLRKPTPPRQIEQQRAVLSVWLPEHHVLLSTAVKTCMNAVKAGKEPL